MIRLFSILLLCQSLSAANLFVATNGNDSADGTSTNTAWLTISESVVRMSGGDTLNILGGTYGEYIDDIIPGGTSWNNVTTIQAYNGETVRLNPVTPDSVDVIGLQGDDTKYIVFNGLIIDGRNMVGSDCCVKGTYNVPGAPAHHIRFTNCIIEKANNGHCFNLSGGADYVPTSWQILNCIVRESGYNGDLSGSGDHGIYIHTSSNLVEGCEIYGCEARAIQNYNNTPSSNIYRNNRIHDNGIGIGIFDGTNNLVYNNVLWNNAQTALAVQAAGFNWNNSFVFNTIYGNGSSMRLFCSPGYELGSIVVQNNIVAGQTNLFVGAISVEDDRAGSATITIQNNVLSGDGLIGQIYEENVELAIAASNNLTNQSSAGFANVSAINFNLRADSVARDRGIAVAGITNDFLGLARFNPPDVGALECYSTFMNATVARVGIIRAP